MREYRRTIAAFLIGAVLFTTVPVWGQDLNTLLVNFLSDLRSGTFSIGTGKDIVISSNGDGAVTFTANGDGSDEALTIDLDDTSNEIALSSSTGASSITFTSGANVLSLAPTQILIASAGSYEWGSRGAIRAAADGVFNLQNNAGSDFSRLQFGGTTSSFPALKRSSTALAVRLADDSADAPLTASNVTASGQLIVGARPTVTVDGATTFAVAATYTILACTGAETINTITGGVTGTLLYLENSDTECTIADDDSATASNAVDLTGTATNDVGAVAKVIILIYNGSHWLQLGESDN